MSDSTYIMTQAFIDVERAVRQTLPGAAKMLQEIELLCGSYLTVGAFDDELNELREAGGLTNESGRIALARILLTEDTFETWARYDDIRQRTSNPDYETAAR